MRHGAWGKVVGLADRERGRANVKGKTSGAPKAAAGSLEGNKTRAECQMGSTGYH